MSNRKIASIALVISVLGLSFGFAAFTNTLTIKTEAVVRPDITSFNVEFVGGIGGSITPVVNNTVPGASATEAIISTDASGNPVISNMKATFTETGQSISYVFTTANSGNFKAYLKSITFGNAAGGSSFKLCNKVTEGKQPSEYATDSLVAAACEGISLIFTLGSEDFSGSTVRSEFANPTAHDLIVSDSEQIVITILYATNGAHADGDFTVKFGDIVLLYSSIEY